MRMAVSLEEWPRPWWWSVYARYPDTYINVRCLLALLEFFSHSFPIETLNATEIYCLKSDTSKTDIPNLTLTLLGFFFFDFTVLGGGDKSRKKFSIDFKRKQEGLLVEDQLAASRQMYEHTEQVWTCPVLACLPPPPCMNELTDTHTYDWDPQSDFWVPSLLTHGFAFQRYPIRLYAHSYFVEIFQTKISKKKLNSGGSEGVPRRAPPWAKIFSVSCSVLENLAKSYVGALWRVDATSTGNPGSSPAKTLFVSDDFLTCLIECVVFYTEM